MQQMGNQNEDHHLFTVPVKICGRSQVSNISYHISFRVEQSTRTQAKYTVRLWSKEAHGGIGRPRHSLIPSIMINHELA